MEKSYKVKFYYINTNDYKPDYRLYTREEIIEIAKRMTPLKSNTLNQAIIALKEHKNFDISHTYREITNTDIMNNLKPDKSITNELYFDDFENVMNKDQYIILEFSTLTEKEKLTVATFLDKNIQLRKELISKNRNKPTIISERYIDIVNDFVYEMFLALDYTEAQTMIRKMQNFNYIENEKLIEMLDDIMDNMTVKQLTSKEDEYVTPISKKFWLKIVEENNKEEKELTND